MLSDSHCHLNLAQYEKEINNILEKLNQTPMLIINVGTCYSTSLRAIELSYKNNYLFSSIGLHPFHTDFSLKDLKEINSDEEFLKPEEFDTNFIELLKKEKVVAVGETGLDYKYLNKLKEEDKILKKEKQKEEFKKQIKIAKEFRLPLIIHTRKVYEEALMILEEVRFNPLGFNFKGVFHFFSGNLEQAKKIIQKGFYLGFSGIITYDNRLDEVIKNTPIEKILIETDAPYAAPLPYKGQINYPFYVKEVSKKIAQIKNLDIEEAEKIIFKNTLNFFNISL